MGVINITPDSFSGDGLLDTNAAVKLALLQIEAGADLIDIGGQSTRPGHTPIEPDEELARILPVITALRGRSDAIISVDTHSPKVFAAARQAGADLLNSIWGLERGMLACVKESICPVVIMHNKLVAEYPSSGVVKEVRDYLFKSANQALTAGLTAEQIILDPGIGFGKTADDNLAILSQLHQITSLGFPTLLGTSRKSTIGKLTKREPADRLLGTAATIALAVQSGIDIVRVHDVAEIIDTVRVADAVVRGWRPRHWGRDG